MDDSAFLQLHAPQGDVSSSTPGAGGHDRSPGRRVLITALWAVAVVTLGAVQLVAPGLGGPVGAAFFWLLCIAILARRSPCGMLSPAVLYLLLLGLFHLGAIVPVTLGAAPGYPTDWIRSRHLATALGLFSVATAAFTLGSLVPSRGPQRLGDGLAPHANLFRVGLAVGVLGVTILWIGVAQIGLMSISYAEYFERSAAQDFRLFGFGLMLFPIGILIAAIGASPRQLALLAMGYACAVAPLFVAGFRGPVIVHAAALLAIWARKDLRTARRVAAASAALVLVLAPAVKLARNLDQPLSTALAQAHSLDTLLEAGGSMQALVVTSELIESGAEPLWLGRSYLMAVQRVVPNLSTRWTPAARTRMVTPSAWVTMHTDPWVYERGGGIGFSGVAEPYLNFGRLGVLLFFALLGYVIQFLDVGGEGSPHRAAVAAASLGFLYWTVRNDTAPLLRAVAFAGGAALVSWLAGRLLSRLARR
jgi:hypothetical protein